MNHIGPRDIEDRVLRFDEQPVPLCGGHAPDPLPGHEATTAARIPYCNFEGSNRATHTPLAQYSTAGASKAVAAEDEESGFLRPPALWYVLRS